MILAYDSRTLPSGATPLKNGQGSLSTAQPKYTLSAHDGSASALDINPHIRGCIVTGGMDKNVKVWNVLDEESEGVQGRKREISLVTSRDLGIVSLPFLNTTIADNREKSSPQNSRPIQRHLSLSLQLVQRLPYKSGTLLPTLEQERHSEKDSDGMEGNWERSKRGAVLLESLMRTRMYLTMSRWVGFVESNDVDTLAFCIGHISIVYSDALGALTASPCSTCVPCIPLVGMPDMLANRYPCRQPNQVLWVSDPSLRLTN